MNYEVYVQEHRQQLEQQLTMAVLRGDVTKARFIRQEIITCKYIKEQLEINERKQMEEKVDL